MSDFVPTDLPEIVQCMTCNAVAHRQWIMKHKCDPYTTATFVEREILNRLDRIEQILLKAFS